MERYEIKGKVIEPHNIVSAITSEPDYEMSRIILLEDMPDIAYGEYVLMEGGHCSCYGFDETNWDCIKLTKEELLKILAENNCWYLRQKLSEILNI